MRVEKILTEEIKFTSLSEYLHGVKFMKTWRNNIFKKSIRRFILNIFLRLDTNFDDDICDSQIVDRFFVKNCFFHSE